MHSAEKVILFVVKHVVRQCHARRHQFRDAALHELLRQLRVFQLVADGHALAGTDQLRQVRVEGVMREARHLVALVVTVVTVGQRDAEDTRCRDGVLALRLIEVTTPEEHHRVGVLRLQVEELLHHRGQFLALFLCHLTVLNESAKISNFFLSASLFRRIFSSITLSTNHLSSDTRPVPRNSSSYKGGQ